MCTCCCSLTSSWASANGLEASSIGLGAGLLALDAGLLALTDMAGA